MKPTLSTRNRILLAVYILLMGLCVLPALGVVGNNPALLFGIPISILWLLGCFILLTATTVLAYRWVFRPWAKTVDGQTQDAIEKENRQ